MKGPSISIIVAALDEQDGLAPSVHAIQAALNDICSYEIIVVDDGSRDRTGAIADDLAAGSAGIRVIHNPCNLGLGGSYRRGFELVRGQYTLLIPADNETPSDTIRAIAKQAGRADIIVTHTLNWYIRPVHRWILSHLYTAIVNALFGFRLRYYNGICLIRSAALRTIALDTSGSAYMTAILVRLLKQGYSYAGIGIMLQPRCGARRPLGLRSFIDVARSIGRLWVEVRLLPVLRRGSPAAASPRPTLPVGGKEAAEGEDPARVNL